MKLSYLMSPLFVIEQIDETVRGAGEVVLVTLGPELLRQQLLPECARRGIQLPDYFFSYIDLFDVKKDTSSVSSASIPKRLADLLESEYMSRKTCIM